MKIAWALVIMAAAACGGGGGSSGSVDAPAADSGMAPDADADADAGPMTDTDGDGVLDSVDVCPTIADPAQVDPDGDHVGWMCDPIETTTIPYTGIPEYFRLAVRGNTAGASFQYGCAMGGCKSAALSVGPGGVSRSDSQVDTWLMMGRPGWGWVSGENRVLWGFLAGRLGEHNAVTDTFTLKYDGNLLGGDLTGTTRFERDQLTVLPSSSPTQGYALLEPRENGDVFVIAESASQYDIQLITGHDPANFVFTKRTPSGDTLQRFAPGAAASGTMNVGSVMLSHTYDVQKIATERGALVGLCVDQDSVRYFLPTDDNTASGQVLPLSTCNVYGAETTDHRLRVIVSPVDGSNPTGGVVSLIGGVMRTVAISSYGVEVFGASTPAAVRTLDPATFGVQAVSAISATGAVVPVTGNVTESIVSTEGETIHVLAKRGANRVLFRYRNGTVSEVTMPAFTAMPDETALLTTKEGAALISTYTTAFVVPSQAMTVTAIDFDNLKGFVRGDATLFFASHNQASSKPALYSYSEVSGVPVYLALTPESNTSLYAYPLDGRDGAPTGWFAYVTDGACLIARPEVVGTAVTLAGNVTCLAGALIDGVTRDNKLIVRVSSNTNTELLYLIGGNTITKVASSSRQFQLLYAAQDSQLALGWIGSDSGDDFVCLGTHPERCWPALLATHTWAAPVPGQPDAIHVVFLRQIAGAVELTSIRSIGPGTRPQPL